MQLGNAHLAKLHPATRPPLLTASVWSDESMLEPIFARVQTFLPRLDVGEALGLNARWRLYKYGRKDIFRHGRPLMDAVFMHGGIPAP